MDKDKRIQQLENALLRAALVLEILADHEPAERDLALGIARREARLAREVYAQGE